MNYNSRQATRVNAQGKWRGILLMLGITELELSGKHGPCPLCEGKDRYRYTDYKGNGEYFCSGCGPGSGFDLIMGRNDWDFAHAAQEVDKVLGTKIEEVFQPRVDFEKRRRDMNRLWANATDRGLVERYLRSRGISAALIENPLDLRDLRGHPQMFMMDSNKRHSAMLALIRNKDGAAISIHRTYTDLGLRRVMPPLETIKGCAIRLGSTLPGKPLIVGEGIETVLSGMEDFGGAGYACISAGNMEEVILPASVKDVIILADNDKSFTGQKSAFVLARKLDAKKIEVQVMMRANIGADWNDRHEGKDNSILSWGNLGESA